MRLGEAAKRWAGVRAASLCRLANLLLDDGRSDLVQLVKTKLYDGTSNSLIKKDLEYVSHNWGNACVDLWEEVGGNHFYTRIVQRRALRDGAKLATRLADSGAAGWYNSQLTALEGAILGHWDDSQKFLKVTLNQNGKDYKCSGLDTAVILGILHASTADDPFLPPTDGMVLATAQAHQNVRGALPP